VKKHHHERIDIGRTETDNVSFNLKIKDDVGLLFGSLKGDADCFFNGKIRCHQFILKINFKH
jgi:hypothetical protein